MGKHLFSFFSSKQGPAAVKNLSEEMVAFLYQCPLALLLVDATGRIIFSNPRAASLLLTSEKVLNSSYVDRFGLTMDKVRSLAQSTPPKKIIIELVNDQAESIFVGGAASFLAATPFIILTLESIPHFTQLTRDNTFLRTLVDASPFAIVVQNLAGKCLLWSRAAQDLFGYREEDTVGQDIYPFLPKELVPSLQRLDNQILQERASQPQTQLSYKDEGGQAKVLNVTKIFMPAENGKDLRILTLFEDCTQHHYYEQDLVQNRNLLRAVLENVPLGLYTRDCEGKVTFYNRQSLQVLNEKDEANVSRAHQYQTKQDTDRHHSRELEILREGKIKDYPEEEYTDSQGNKKILHLRKVPLKDAGPKPLVLSIVEDITEHLQQEREVRRVNGLLTAIVQNAPVGLYARNGQGRMLMRNQQCSKIFGAPEEANPMFDENGNLPHETPEQISEYMERERKLIASGKTLYIPEESYVAGDGTTKWLRMIKVPVNGEGQEQFVVTLVEDITQRKAQEKDLLETKNFLQTLLDNVPVAIYARGADDTIMFVNRRAREMFPGEKEGEQEGRHEFYEKREESIFENADVLDLPEESYTTLEGKKILLHLVKAPVFDKDGKPFMVLTVAEDITQKKAQEQEIVDARNFLQAVINNLPLSLSVKTYDGKYILWNKKSEELFGVSAHDVIGRTSYRSDMTQEQQEFLREGDLKVFESRKELNIPQELISTASEGVKIMHTVKTPVFHEDGTPSSLLIVSEDITAKTRMEKQIREASDKNTLLVENAREGVLLAEDKKVMYANHALCQMLGYARLEDLTDKPLLDLVAADYKEVLKEKYEAVVAGTAQAAQSVALTLLRQDGQPVEVEFSAVASRYLGRRIVLCFLRDVTAQNRAYQELSRERDSYRLAFEKAAVPCFVLLHNGYISLMNEACRNLVGLNQADKNFYRNVYIRPALSLAVRRKLRAGEPAEMNYVFDFARAAEKFPGRFDPSRAKLVLHLEFIPMNRRTGKDGQIRADYAVAVTMPRAPQVSVKRRLLRRPLPPNLLAPVSAQEMLVLPNSEPYALCTSDFKMQTCNDLFCELCQLSEKELLGNPISYIMDEESRAQFEQDLDTLAQTGSLSNRDYFINPASGLEKIAVRLSAIHDKDRYLFVLRNRTVHLQLLKVLEERSAQLNALLESTDGVIFSVLLYQGRLGALDGVSQYLAQKTGYSQDELAHLQFKDLFASTSAHPFDSVLSKAHKDLAAQGKATFNHPVRRKDGSQFEAQISLTVLDVPGQQAVLAVLRDLSEHKDEWSRTSKEARELQSVRAALPGLYLKTDAAGKALEVYSNLDYLSEEEAVKLFIGHTPQHYWGKEAAAQALLTIKEALSVNVASRFDLAWKWGNSMHYFDVSVTPIAGRDEVVLWLKDVSQNKLHERQIHELYRLTSNPSLSITDQVDQILAFGLKAFRADVGFVARFEPHADGTRSHILYVTENEGGLERGLSFPVEECLYDVADGRVLLWPDLSAASCHKCVHVKTKLAALVAAPLLVGGKIMGALCFASYTPRRSFDIGAEELMGLLARLLSLRIELRQTGKMLSEASRSLAQTLEYVDKPAVLLDLDYQMTFASQALLDETGRHIANMLGRNFFEEIIRNPDLSKRSFQEAVRRADGSSFTLPLEIRTKKAVYEERNWNVIVCKDDNGNIESYGLIAA